MASESKTPKIPAVFYRTADGNEPVRAWLKSLSRGDRREIGSDLLDAQSSWPLGMPLVRLLGKGLWELRTRLDNRIARVMFCFEDGQLVLLHGFIKKSQKTPQSDLDLTRNRMKEVKE